MLIQSVFLWKTSDSRIVISSEARNLPCRPINDGCVNAEIRRTKASVPIRVSLVSVFVNATFGHRPIYTRGETRAFISHSSKDFVHNQGTARPQR